MRRIGPKRMTAPVHKAILFSRRRFSRVIIAPVRWLYHIARRGDPIREKDGFVHASFAAKVRESAEVHFKGVDPGTLVVSAIDPRRLDVRVEIAETPRGAMPHIHGAIPKDAVRATIA